MAQPGTLKGTQFFFKVESAPGSGVYTHPCLINAARALSLTSQGNDVYTPDCDNPDLPAIREHFKTAIQVSLTGAGKLDTASLATYFAWAKSDDAKQVQVWWGTFAYFECAFKLTTFENQGDRGDKIEADITLESHGLVGDLQVQ